LEEIIHINKSSLDSLVIFMSIEGSWNQDVCFRVKLLWTKNKRIIFKESNPKLNSKGLMSKLAYTWIFLIEKYNFYTCRKLFLPPITVFTHNYLQEQFVICVLKIMTGSQVCLEEVWAENFFFFFLRSFFILLLGTTNCIWTIHNISVPCLGSQKP
jgi:hypothetical protein